MFHADTSNSLFVCWFIYLFRRIRTFSPDHHGRERHTRDSQFCRERSPGDPGGLEGCEESCGHRQAWAAFPVSLATGRCGADTRGTCALPGDVPSPVRVREPGRAYSTFARRFRLHGRSLLLMLTCPECWARWGSWAGPTRACPALLCPAPVHQAPAPRQASRPLDRRRPFRGGEGFLSRQS